MTDHVNCTCCRHWRHVEQLSNLDMAEQRERARERAAEIVGEGPEDEPVFGLLPARPFAPLARSAS
jgi:hypothetical protein